MESSRLQNLIKEKLVLFKFQADPTQLTALTLKLVEKKRLDNPDEKIAKFFEPFFKDEALNFVKCVSDALKEEKNDIIATTEDNSNVNKEEKVINNPEKKSTSISINDISKEEKMINEPESGPHSINENHNVKSNKRKATFNSNDEPNEPIEKISKIVTKENENKELEKTTSITDTKEESKSTTEGESSNNSEKVQPKERPKRQRIVFDIGTVEATKEEISCNLNSAKSKLSGNEGLCNIAKKALGDLVNSEDIVAKRMSRFGVVKTNSTPTENKRKRRNESSSQSDSKNNKIYRLKPPVDAESYASNEKKRDSNKDKKYEDGKINNLKQNKKESKIYTPDCTTKVVLKSDESSSEEEDINIDDILNNYYSKRINGEDGENKKNEISVASQSAFTPHMVQNKMGTRCKFWPQCRNTNDDCPFIHPTQICTKFPYCYFGAHCLYIHPICKFNKNCLNPSCVFTHTSSDDLPVANLSDEKKEVVDDNACIQLSQEVKSSSFQEVVSIIPCSFGGKCKKPCCPYNHPKMCRYGKECNNAFCFFRHIEVSSKEQCLNESTTQEKDTCTNDNTLIAKSEINERSDK
uniref:Zinc finger CCCH domain-containing protein 14 n=1 Tax=Parastrongyloides trichosuri TaxID=131310 RepID=A0A0N4ZS11_PARTI